MKRKIAEKIVFAPRVSFRHHADDPRMVDGQDVVLWLTLCAEDADGKYADMGQVLRHLRDQFCRYLPR